MDFRVSHIYREGNHCALANLGIENKLEFVWYSTMPPNISLDFFHNKFEHPMFKVVKLGVYFVFLYMGLI